MIGIDTSFLATWHQAGITDIYTLNPADFTLFAHFTPHPASDPT
jgi:hypothetical protein